MKDQISVQSADRMLVPKMKNSKSVREWLKNYINYFFRILRGGDSLSMKTIKFWNMKKYKDRKITPPTRVKWKIKKYIYGYSYFMTSWYIETKNMIFQILCFFAATAAQEAHLSLYQGTKMHPFNRKLVSVHNRNILAVREGFKKSVSGKK